MSQKTGWQTLPEAGEICNLSLWLQSKSILDLTNIDVSIVNEKDKMATPHHCSSFDTHIKYQRSSTNNNTQDKIFIVAFAGAVPDVDANNEKKKTKEEVRNIIIEALSKCHPSFVHFYTLQCLSIMAGHLQFFCLLKDMFLI